MLTLRYIFAFAAIVLIPCQAQQSQQSDTPSADDNAPAWTLVQQPPDNSTIDWRATPIDFSNSTDTLSQSGPGSLNLTSLNLGAVNASGTLLPSSNGTNSSFGSSQLLVNGSAITMQISGDIAGATFVSPFRPLADDTTDPDL